MKNKETKMTIKDLEAWSLFAAHAADGILASMNTQRVNMPSAIYHREIVNDAVSIADKLLEERRKRQKEGVKRNH